MRPIAFFVALFVPLAPLGAEEPLGLTTQGPMQVGDVIPADHETEHPYVAARTETLRLVRSDEIHLPGATYVAPFFSRFELAPGDFVLVRSPSGDRQWRFEGYGKAELGRTEGFWGIHVTGERLVVDLYSRGNAAGAWGYRIDRVARGFVPLGARAVCGTDDRENAGCYEDSDPEVYARGRAVVRLLIQGSGLCTGWLVGSEGHMMTNNHCIDTASDALNTDYEFGAEGACLENCPQLACDGTIETTSGTLIQTSGDLDYSLVLLDPALAEEYGFLQLRSTDPVPEERIYIPQHPAGRGKEIAVFSTDPADGSGFGEIDTVFQSGGPRRLATYYADTEGGSSGSPVIAHSDHCAVVVHSGAFGCSGLGNTGTVTSQIITDLGANVPDDAVVASGPCTAERASIHSDGFESGDTSGWS